uniref:Uncharacterized protein n=1 Tax=Malurus cyaneus samueli TaxID=2593467 RepID=A0A8C5X2R1_9PASS
MDPRNSAMLGLASDSEGFLGKAPRWQNWHLGGQRGSGARRLRQGRGGREEEKPRRERRRGRNAERCSTEQQFSVKETNFSEGNLKLKIGLSQEDEKTTQKSGELCVQARHKNQHQAATEAPKSGKMTEEKSEHGAANRWGLEMVWVLDFISGVRTGSIFDFYLWSYQKSNHF